MATINANTSPQDALRAIIAAGVARYQESLPDYARDETPVIVIPDHALPDDEQAHPVITLDDDRQRELCLSCPMADCVGVAASACPIRIEMRRIWREKNERGDARKGARSDGAVNRAGRNRQHHPARSRRDRVLPDASGLVLARTDG